MLKAISLRGVKNRVFGAFGSFTWSGKAVKTISDFAGKMNFTVPSASVEMKQGFSLETAEKCIQLGLKLGEEIKKA